MKKKITIGIPTYNEEQNIERIYKKIETIIKKYKHYNFEYIFVDNHSIDKTKILIKNLIKKDKRIKGIFLSRNFGPEASLSALIDYSLGDVFIGIPCDLQDPPELILKFIKKWNEGYNIVIGVYKKSEDNFITSILRKSFYSVFKKISNIEVPINASGVGLLDRRALDALKSLPEKFRFFRGLRSWIGFKTAHVYYERNKRQHGKSSYRIFDYFKHAERGLFGFSYLVLDLMAYFSFLLVILSFLFIIGYLFTVFVFGNPIQASIPLMLTIVFFGGIQLLAISIIGKYIQVIVEETKARPMYIVDEVINLEIKNQKSK